MNVSIGPDTKLADFLADLPEQFVETKDKAVASVFERFVEGDISFEEMVDEMGGIDMAFSFEDDMEGNE